ncbi:hypothetical protein [Pseudochelatococcus sp. G4_1912]|uniref:hypothetical protein n=1 Tax=Pseudochelatococcus sp. G4_1912 TaxID=3114288 RepID=UPI0039C6084A
MSNVSFSSQVYAVSSSVSNDKLADVKWASADSAATTVTYRNAFTAFFGRAVSWVFDGGANKSLKDRYVADMMARTSVTGAARDEFLKTLSGLVDVNSRKPLSAYVVKMAEEKLERSCTQLKEPVGNVKALVGYAGLKFKAPGSLSMDPYVQEIKDKSKSKVSQDTLKVMETLNDVCNGPVINIQNSICQDSANSHISILSLDDKETLEELVGKLAPPPKSPASPIKKTQETAPFYWSEVTILNNSV